MDPARVLVGNYQAAAHEAPTFRAEDFARGGRQVAPDLIEFYTKDDPTSVRVDLWVDDPSQTEAGEIVFEASLQLRSETLSIWSLDEPCEVPVPPGRYHVRVTLVNRGQTSGRMLTDSE